MKVAPYLLGLLLIIVAIAALSQWGASQSNSAVAIVRDAKASCAERAAAFADLFNGRNFQAPKGQDGGHVDIRQQGQWMFVEFQCSAPFAMMITPSDRSDSEEAHRAAVDTAVAIARALGSAEPHLRSAFQGACAKAKDDATTATRGIDFADVDVVRFTCGYDLHFARSVGDGWGNYGVEPR